MAEGRGDRIGSLPLRVIQEQSGHFAQMSDVRRDAFGQDTP